MRPSMSTTCRARHIRWTLHETEATLGNRKGQKITSGEVRTHALTRGPELESGALTTRPQMLARVLG